MRASSVASRVRGSTAHFKRALRGYSLLELVVAIFILYLSSLYLLSTFAVGGRHVERTREYSTTTFLARSRLERLLSMPAEAVLQREGRSGKFAAPYAEYEWQVSLREFSDMFAVLVLEVQSPAGARTRLQALRPRQHHYGICCDSFSHNLVFASARDGGVWRRDEGQRRATLALGARATGRNDWEYSGVVGAPLRGFLWTADNCGSSVSYSRFSASGSLQSTSVVNIPARYAGQKPCFVGIAGDPWASRLFCADIANAAVWILYDDAVRGKKTWDARNPVKPEVVPLGCPAVLAVDDSASLLWVGDSKNGCLRVLQCDTSVSHSTTTHEREAGIGWWGPPLAPNLGGKMVSPGGRGALGAIRGVSVNGWSSLVHTLNDTHLFTARYSTGSGEVTASQWKRVALPEELSKSYPRGLASDPYGCALYINTVRGDVWKYVVATGTFSIVEGR